MDYMKATNAEINKLVSEKYLGYLELGHRFVNNGQDSSKHYSESYPLLKLTNNIKYWEPFEPCSDASAAWKIITSTPIDLSCDDTFTPSQFKQGESLWAAHSGKGFHWHDENPLRAAMIVYLLEQDAKS